MCFVPFTVRNKFTGKSYAAPCGKCPLCVKRRIHQWTHRLLQEEKVSKSAHFITLTYDTKNIPFTDSGYETLDKDDIQKFWKKLRKRMEYTAIPIKYYMVGEYGAQTYRPHYHAIVFNATDKSICESWDKGAIQFGTVEVRSIQYTVGYFSKGCQIPCSDFDDRHRKFSCMSKQLGLSYLTKAMVKWHKNDLKNRMYINSQDGKKVSMARYYKEKLYHKTERNAIGVNVRKTMEKNYEKELSKNKFLEADLFQNRKAAIRVQKQKAIKQGKI